MKKQRHQISAAGKARIAAAARRRWRAYRAAKHNGHSTARPEAVGFLAMIERQIEVAAHARARVLLKAMADQLSEMEKGRHR